MDYIFMGRNSGSMDIHFCADYCLMKIRDVYTFMVRVSSSSYWSRASVWVSATAPSWEESVISANPLWFGRFQ